MGHCFSAPLAADLGPDAGRASLWGVCFSAPFAADLGPEGSCGGSRAGPGICFSAPLTTDSDYGPVSEAMLEALAVEPGICFSTPLATDYVGLRGSSGLSWRRWRRGALLDGVPRGFCFSAPLADFGPSPDSRDDRGEARCRKVTWRLIQQMSCLLYLLIQGILHGLIIVTRRTILIYIFLRLSRMLRLLRS